MTLTVSIADLAASGGSVTGHGEDVAARHAHADGRIEAAQAGWQGRSAAALNARTAQWKATTETLLARLRDHADGLHTSARHYQATEQHGAGELDALR